VDGNGARLGPHEHEINFEICKSADLLKRAKDARKRKDEARRGTLSRGGGLGEEWLEKCTAG
jgi:hypothetical protein